MGPSTHGLNDWMIASFIISRFPGSRLKTQRERVEPLWSLLELDLGKEREFSGATDVTPSTSLTRPQKMSVSVPCTHKGPEQSSFKDFLVTLLHQHLPRSVVQELPRTHFQLP